MKMKLVTRSSSLNSLWSIVYCVVIILLHCYVTYLGVAKYRKLDNDELWGGKIPGELRVYIALVVISVLFLPLFIFFSALKVGNAPNDGTKLGRDHALDGNPQTLGSRLKRDWLKHLWEHFPPFSSLFHLTSAFLLLIPEMTLTAAEVKYGVMSSDAVWSCDLDFLFSSDRASTSNIISQSNVTVQQNHTFYVVPTPRPPIGGWSHDTVLHVAFVYMVAGLAILAIRYSSVFWFTNKAFSAIFATQLLFLTVEAMFAHCGVDILYKLAVNYEKYEENVSIILGSGVIIFLYILSGIVLIASTYFVYSYGAKYFKEKFKIIDRRHHPDAYRKQTVIVNGSCQDYQTHTAAVVALVLLGLFRGPVLYDLVTLYRLTKDDLVLTCVVFDVCYMVYWIFLWTVLTLRQQWQFRILDYVPLNDPVYMISNDNLVKNASYHGGSIELHMQAPRKRPSSLPSDLTASESGFGDANSSEDERERFELSLPPLAEVPGAIENERRKGSTHSLDRRSRSRRNGNQRVTFHDTVKRSTSTDSELYAKNREKRILNISADVHGRQVSRDRGLTPLELAVLKARKPANRHSIGTASPLETTQLNNALYKKQSSYSDIGTGSDYSSDRSRSRPTPDSSIEYNDLTIKNDYALGARDNFKSSNRNTQTNNSLRVQNCPSDKSSSAQTSPVKDAYQTFINEINARSNNRLSPRAMEYMDGKKDVSLVRRDSANYSLTSSQETASNDSDQAQQALCSQSTPSQTPIPEESPRN